jgi:hypothetical protein
MSVFFIFSCRSTINYLCGPTYFNVIILHISMLVFFMFPCRSIIKFFIFPCWYSSCFHAGPSLNSSCFNASPPSITSCGPEYFHVMILHISMLEHHQFIPHYLFVGEIDVNYILTHKVFYIRRCHLRFTSITNSYLCSLSFLYL